MQDPVIVTSILYIILEHVLEVLFDMVRNCVKYGYMDNLLIFCRLKDNFNKLLAVITL